MATMSTDTASAGATTEARFAVSGMTCGSCAARVGKMLADRPGVVDAAVNFATGTATVAYDPGRTSPDDLVAAVDEIGYGFVPAEDSSESGKADAEAAVQQKWLGRVLVAWPLGIAVLVLSMAFMHDSWARWTALALTVPVQFWAGWPFLREAAKRARSFTANMDTLIAIGTLTAFLASTVVLLRGGHHAEVYFETAAVIMPSSSSVATSRPRPRAGRGGPSAPSSSSAPRTRGCCATAPR